MNFLAVFLKKFMHLVACSDLTENVVAAHHVTEAVRSGEAVLEASNVGHADQDQGNENEVDLETEVRKSQKIESDDHHQKIKTIQRSKYLPADRILMTGWSWQHLMSLMIWQRLIIVFFNTSLKKVKILKHNRMAIVFLFLC